MTSLSEKELQEISEIVSSFPEEQREAKARELLQETSSNGSQQCPFCLMTEKKIQTVNVYEDEDFLGVLEINPANPGHILLFPKQHILNLSELQDSKLPALVRIIKNLETALLKIADGTNIYSASDQVAGQRYPHLVINIIPRYKGDKIHMVWEPKPISETELIQMKDKILSHMPKKLQKERLKDEEIILSKEIISSEQRFKGVVYY